MQITSLPFWLMTASSATAVLPVCRSPIISSRCPRPIGTIESIAFRPRLQRLLHGLAFDDARRDALQRVVGVRRDRPALVNRQAERVHPAPDARFPPGGA